MNHVRFALFIFMLAGPALAAPLPLQTIVNNDSMECAMFLPGDECMDCTPPDGWEILGSSASCPERYALVTVEGNCTSFENERCCTKGHSGASGNCKNLARNDQTKECTFVRDASDSILPASWEKMPVDGLSSEWDCPLDYTWTSLAANHSVVAQYGPVNVVSVTNDADFQVNSGNTISGWTWLTKPRQFASWTFYDLPTDRNLYIYLSPLVTRPSGRGGGSGYSTDVRITYQTITGSTNATIALKNTHPEFQMPADTMGWGYQTFGYLTIPADKIPVDGRITITLTKLPNSEHVAVNKGCCTIEFI